MNEGTNSQPLSVLFFGVFCLVFVFCFLLLLFFFNIPVVSACFLNNDLLSVITMEMVTKMKLPILPT